MLSNKEALWALYIDQILGESEAILGAKKLARIFARTSDNILLTGESGTGKELFAQSIHNAANPKGPFIALNCAALPHILVESELFGYEGGSFTGAERKGRVGKIEMANGGTLFLDESGIWRSISKPCSCVFWKIKESCAWAAIPIRRLIFA
jgi:transcriptional regulator with PAS, ATPase and Fis domain